MVSDRNPPNQVETMITEYELKAEDIHQMTLSPLRQHLSLKTEGWRCSSEQTLNLLVKAAAESSSLEAICADTPSAVDGNTLRDQLNAALRVSQLRQQEAEMNAALQAAIPRGMPRGGLEIAIDTHDEPFYGKSAALLPYVCRGPAKDGTTRFFRIATAYVIWRDVRLTLSLTYVLPQDRLPAVVARLLARLSALGLHATVLYLDKGFCCGAIIRYLQQINQAAVLACPIRGTLGGTRALCWGRGSYTTDYTFSDGTVARLLVAELRVLDPQTKRRQQQWLIFVLIQLDWTPYQVITRYQRRFGIEASYRLLRQTKVLTNSRNPALRFFLLGLSLVLQNIWVLARWLFTRRQGKGRSKLVPTLLRFDRFRKLLVRAVELLFPPRLSVSVFASPSFGIH